MSYLRTTYGQVSEWNDRPSNLDWGEPLHEIWEGFLLRKIKLMSREKTQSTKTGRKNTLYDPSVINILFTIGHHVSLKQKKLPDAIVGTLEGPGRVLAQLTGRGAVIPIFGWVIGRWASRVIRRGGRRGRRVALEFPTPIRADVVSRVVGAE